MRHPPIRRPLYRFFWGATPEAFLPSCPSRFVVPLLAVPIGGDVGFFVFETWSIRRDTTWGLLVCPLTWRVPTPVRVLTGFHLLPEHRPSLRAGCERWPCSLTGHADQSCPPTCHGVYLPTDHIGHFCPPADHAREGADHLGCANSC